MQDNHSTPRLKFFDFTTERRFQVSRIVYVPFTLFFLLLLIGTYILHVWILELISLICFLLFCIPSIKGGFAYIVNSTGVTITFPLAFKEKIYPWQDISHFFTHKFYVHRRYSPAKIYLYVGCQLKESKKPAFYIPSNAIDNNAEILVQELNQWLMHYDPDTTKYRELRENPVETDNLNASAWWIVGLLFIWLTGLLIFGGYHIWHRNHEVFNNTLINHSQHILKQIQVTSIYTESHRSQTIHIPDGINNTSLHFSGRNVGNIMKIAFQTDTHHDYCYQLEKKPCRWHANDQFIINPDFSISMVISPYCEYIKHIPKTTIRIKTCDTGKIIQTLKK